MNLISDDIFIKVENDILSGKLKKGDMLSENMIANEYGVSRTPARETIKKLEQEGLVKYTNSKTVNVVGVTKEDVVDVYNIRLLIEGEACKKAAVNMTEEDYIKLKNDIDLQEFYNNKKDADSVKEEDTFFHKYIYSLSKSYIYESVLNQLHKKIQQYRKISITNNERSNVSVSEHREILDAMHNKDFDKISELTKKHILNAMNNILKLI